MAAMCRNWKMIKSCKFLFLRTNYRFASSSVESPVSTDVTVTESSAGDDDPTPDNLSSLQDISRMPKRYRDRMLHALTPPPPLDYISELHQKVTARQALYGKYGRKSGVEPGVMWPTPDEELRDMIDFEKDWEPSLQERWKKSMEEKKLEAKERRIKNEFVTKQMAKMPEIINQYRARLAKADEQELLQEKKRQALMNEAREFFGYDLDRSDPRFEQMALAKEEEEKKLKKKKKKDEKLAKITNIMKSAQ